MTSPRLPKTVGTSLRIAIVLMLLSVAFGSVPVAAEQPLRFNIRLLSVDANEGIAAGDIDGDGKLDIVAGRNWYRNGDWAPRPLRNIEDWNGYVQSNGDYLFDVDNDGWLDVIAGSFVPTEVHWYRNPGAEGLRLGQQWEKKLLFDTGLSANEGQLLEDLNGDGNPEWISNSWKAERALVVWSLVPKTEKPQPGESAYEIKRRVIGEHANGHGLAVGDLNGDGRKDILVGNGWYEQPVENPWQNSWKFHPDWDLHASLPMIVADLDGDGDNGLIFGNGHDYGLQWWENVGTADGKTGRIEWREHLIDREFSQPHTLAWKDLDGDGKPDLITGKRYYAHNGNDPGGKDAPCLYWYKWNPASKTFKRYTIDEGQVGTGLQIVVEDFNQDGRMDIAVAGKSGTYLLIAQP